MKNGKYTPQLYTQHLLKQNIIECYDTEVVKNQKRKYYYQINSNYILSYRNLNNIISLYEVYTLDNKFKSFELTGVNNQVYHMVYPEKDIIIYKKSISDIYYKDLVLINAECQDSTVSIIFCNKHRQFDELEFDISIQNIINTIIKSYKDVIIDKEELFIEKNNLEELKKYITKNIEDLKNDN
jgi:hypothetical protein